MSSSGSWSKLIGRLHQLEGQMSTVTSRLDQISSLLLGMVSGSNGNNNYSNNEPARPVHDLPPMADHQSTLGLRQPSGKLSFPDRYSRRC